MPVVFFIQKAVANLAKSATTMVREAGLEPARPEWTLEPESSESANSTTRASAISQLLGYITTDIPACQAGGEEKVEDRLLSVSGGASGGPIFSLAREKIGEKRVLGCGWCVLRVRFRQALIFGCCEHTKSPYGRYGTRRLLRYSKFAGNYDSMSAVKTRCVRNL